VPLLSTRTKLVVTGILLCVALGATIFCAVQTVQAVQRFREEHALTTSGDVRTIRPWMTIHDISRVYHVPENYLYKWLDIANPQSVRHATLDSLAARYHRSLDGLIGDVQNAIRTYRKEHQSYSSSSRNAQGPPSLRRRET
jgi:hypothetical protein